jgi:hypothetical protein
MLTFDLINKKRRPVKIYAISGIVTGILLLILIGLFGDKINDSIKKAILCISASGFVTGLFVLSYSIKFKNVIGHISFSKEFIEIELLQRKEIIHNKNITDIKFELVGFDGLNKTIIPQGLYDLSYRSGINNFVYIQTNNNTRKFEFYVPNQQNWINLQRIVSYYQDTFGSKNK